MEVVILAAGIGVLVGVVVGALGAGGGILSMPVLVYVLGFEPHAAAAASLLIVGASAFVPLLPHARAGNVQWGQGLAFGGLGAAGALVGSWLSRLIDAELLMVLLAVLLLAVAVTMLRRSWLAARRERGEQAGRSPAGGSSAGGSGSAGGSTAGGTAAAGGMAAGEDSAAGEDLAAGAAEQPAGAGQGVAVPPDEVIGAQHKRARRRRMRLTIVAASLSGLLTGLFGVGGGFIVVPALVLVMGVGMRTAVGTSLLVIIINTAVGAVGRIGESYPVDWAVVIAFVITSMVGGLIGARLSTRARPATLSLLFGLLLAVVAVATVAQVVPTLLAA